MIDLVNSTLLEIFYSPQPTELWFSYQDVPLKWQIPIGVLYDLVGGDTLPWEIKLRISDFPADKLARLGTTIEETVCFF